MSHAYDFSRCGGVQAVRAGGDPNDPADAAWNFGVQLDWVVESPAPAFYDLAPNMQGRWDGKTPVNHHEAARKVLGKDLPPHLQPRGTCGGRAGSRGAEHVQCVMIAAGKRAKFNFVSHAWLYYLARREYGMLRGGDGVPDGAVPPAMAKYGLLTRDESGDLSMAGDGSDDLAVAWGGGRLSAAKAAEFEHLAGDNIVQISAKVRSAAEAADAIASGGVLVCSDAQGYSMTRDGEGFCAPSGTWYHYHVRSGIVVTPRGRKGFAYDQSWGRNTPSGSLLPGYPDNCFGVDWDVQDRLCRSGSVHALFGFPLWDLEKGVDLDWVV